MRVTKYIVLTIFVLMVVVGIFLKYQNDQKGKEMIGYLNKAHEYEQQGADAKAIEYYQKMIVAAPQTASAGVANIGISMIYFKQKNLEKALYYCNQASESPQIKSEKMYGFCTDLAINENVWKERFKGTTWK